MPARPHILFYSAWSFCLLACGSSSAPVEAVAARDTTVTRPASESPRVLGLRLNSLASGLRERLPSMAVEVATPEQLTLQGDHVFGARAYHTQLTFYEGALARVSASASDVTLADYEALVRGLEGDLGRGDRLVCTSEIGPPLEAYLASGRGSSSIEWNQAQVIVRLSLTPLPGGRLGFFLHAEWLPLTSAHPLPSLDFKRGRSKQAAPTCSELGPSPPSVAGFAFGQSADEVRALLGTDARIERVGVTVPHRLAGMDGELTLHFYDDCLAVAMFQAPGTLPSYRAIQAALLAELGEAERREQCTQSGDAPDETVIASGRAILVTRWETPAIRASVRLSRSHIGAPEMGVGVEVAARALEGRAPHIDFGR